VDEFLFEVHYENSFLMSHRIEVSGGFFG